MNKQTILRNFLIDLDELLADNEYYDDNLKTTICNITEDHVYDILMRIDEYHFIGTENVKSLINEFMNDFRFRMEVLMAYKAV